MVKFQVQMFWFLSSADLAKLPKQLDEGAFTK